MSQITSTAFFQFLRERKVDVKIHQDKSGGTQIDLDWHQPNDREPYHMRLVVPRAFDGDDTALFHEFLDPAMIAIRRSLGESECSPDSPETIVPSQS